MTEFARIEIESLLPFKSPISPRMSTLQELPEEQLHLLMQASREEAEEPLNHTMPVSHVESDEQLHRAASAFESLPKELLEHILEYLVHDPAKLLPFDQRASLSFESFASAPPHVPEDANNILKFRLLCKRFRALGRSRVFSRVKIRFSKVGFDKILSLVVEPEIAMDVRKLSYMVHDLYPQDKAKWQQLLKDARTSTAACQRRFDEIRDSNNAERAQSTPGFRRLEAELRRCRRNETLIMQAMARAEEQEKIILGDVDEKALTAALTAFKNLQQIRLMRNVDKLDQDWEAFLNIHPTLRQQFVASRWTVACERATKVLGRAYLTSESKAHRLSSRFMDPKPAWLQDHISEAAISSLCTRLTCLELQIDDPSNLNEKMIQLSNVFRTLFHAAKKMEGLHIGLCRQISTPLETIFHNITWLNLLYIGFSRWSLPGDQIIGFIRRHRGSLKSVRFREVRLTEGRWIDIAKILRLELKLKWVSFRQVGYDPRIGGGPVPETGPGGGFAMLRGPPTDDYEEYSSDSSDDIGEHVGMVNGAGQATEPDETSSSEDNHSDAEDNDSDETVAAVNVGINGTMQSFGGSDEGAPSDNNQAAGSIDEDINSIESEDSPSGSVAGDSEVGVVNSLALDDQTMVQHSSAFDQLVPPDCDCENGYAWGELEDDYGLDPTKSQWKTWERWVVRGCSEHDPKGP